MKSSKPVSYLHHHHHDIKLIKFLQEELKGNSIFKNIWDIYFSTKQGIATEVKINNFNSILSIIKSQADQILKLNNELKAQKCEIEKLKEHYEIEKITQQNFVNIIEEKNEIIKTLQGQNYEFKCQLSEYRVQKNLCEEKIIELSNKYYQLQRGIPFEIQQHEEMNTLDQYSAISIDHNEDREPSQLSLFCKKQSFNFEIGQILNQFPKVEPEGDSRKQMEDFNLYPPRSRHPLKRSLQFYNRDDPCLPDHQQFIEEMKKMKVQAEKIMKFQNEQFIHRDQKRRITSLAQKNTENIHFQKQNRRFKRIRC